MRDNPARYRLTPGTAFCDQSKRQHPRTRDAQVLAIYNLLKGFPDLVKDFYQFLPEEDRAGAREVVAAEVLTRSPRDDAAFAPIASTTQVARLESLGGRAARPTAVAPPCVPTLPYSEALSGASVGWRLDTTATALPEFLAGRVQGAPTRPGFRLPPPPSMAPPVTVVAPPENEDVRRALDALRNHLARFCQNAHSVDPRDRSLAEEIGGLERVAARFAVKAAPDAFAKVSDVVARCAVRVGTNGSDGDLEGLARALRAMAFDAKTARVYDAVVHVLPDAAKVLGAVAKLA